MAEKPSAGRIIQSFEGSASIRIKNDPTLLLEIFDKPLQEVASCHLARTVVVERSNGTKETLVRPNGGLERERNTQSIQWIHAQGWTWPFA